MAIEIKEPDWKLFRQMKTVALERFCKRVLAELHTATAECGSGSHDQYLRVYDLIRDRDKTLAGAFDDMRRSNALVLLANIRQEGLLTADEWAQFSAETLDSIKVMEHMRRR